ncbi:unnamed protein product [Rotaria magnacalcarata]|uniref:G-protein coupled receptors family 1 profile domain-containing protein n=2 Tax=Rotaria magnacalcarata TaxID=392030 RepID=A0A816LH39_9BILA|nr:unnamed protein product [Rotaria magnacalcarata]CAF1665470.1 unnamed protein product [Rotaria magnacalcarata]CAF1934841.1 unnamed protein product [Rotaria magnacalcarata]
MGLLAPLMLLSKNLSICVTQQWMPYYKLGVIVIFPSLISIIANSVIFNFACLSTRRIRLHGGIASMNPIRSRQERLRHREVYLLKQMAFMFCVHVGGWAPIYIIAASNIHGYLFSALYGFFFVLAQISTLCNILNLFLCHHEIRQYLINQIQQLL